MVRRIVYFLNVMGSVGALNLGALDQLDGIHLFTEADADAALSTARTNWDGSVSE